MALVYVSTMVSIMRFLDSHGYYGVDCIGGYFRKE